MEEKNKHIKRIIVESFMITLKKERDQISYIQCKFLVLIYDAQELHLAHLKETTLLTNELHHRKQRDP